MIAALKGKLLHHFGETIILDVNGVGYEVNVSGGIVSTLGPIGSTLSILVYTDVRENSLSLFGFTSQAEKEVFLLLKQVKGIGARLALNIVSRVGAHQLLASIAQQDAKTLRAVPGIGKKTAERILLELHEKVGALVGKHSSDEAMSFALPTARPSTSQDAALALEKLGFSAELSQKAVARAAEALGASDNSSQLLERALLYLGELSGPDSRVDLR